MLEQQVLLKFLLCNHAGPTCRHSIVSDIIGGCSLLGWAFPGSLGWCKSQQQQPPALRKGGHDDVMSFVARDRSSSAKTPSPSTAS